MTYKQKTVTEILNTVRWPISVGAVLEALESTQEQKALRADEERVDWMAAQKTLAIHSRKGRFAFNPSINYEYELLPLREAIDKARGA